MLTELAYLEGTQGLTKETYVVLKRKLRQKVKRHQRQKNVSSKNESLPITFSAGFQNGGGGLSHLGDTVESSTFVPRDFFTKKIKFKYVSPNRITADKTIYNIPYRGNNNKIMFYKHTSKSQQHSCNILCSGNSATLHLIQFKQKVLFFKEQQLYKHSWYFAI